MRHFWAVLLLVCGATFYGACGAADVGVEPGLVGEYFDMGQELNDFPTVAADKAPTVKKLDKQINIDSVDANFNGTNLSVQFYVRWTGKIRIIGAGTYTFTLESDDGSRLFIDGKQVVDNGGQHAMEEKSGEIELTPGDHDIKVEYFQSGGGAGCKLSWAGLGFEKQIVSDAVFFHLKGSEK